MQHAIFGLGFTLLVGSRGSSCGLSAHIGKVEPSQREFHYPKPGQAAVDHSPTLARKIEGVRANFEQAARKELQVDDSEA